MRQVSSWKLHCTIQCFVIAVVEISFSHSYNYRREQWILKSARSLNRHLNVSTLRRGITTNIHLDVVFRRIDIGTWYVWNIHDIQSSWANRRRESSAQSMSIEHALDWFLMCISISSSFISMPNWTLNIALNYKRDFGSFSPWKMAFFFLRKGKLNWI